MSLMDKVEIPRRTMVLFFIIDTSGSMSGSKIGAVNTAIREVIPEIKDLSEGNADALIKIAVLEFSSGARWITENGPVEASQFNWKNMEAAGCTDFGAACKALKEKLSATKGFMQEATGSFAPALFLLSDGGPTDDWKTELDQLWKNNWFKASVKVAVAIGDDADKDVLKEFTNTKGSMEAVLEAHNSATLMKMIKFVSVTASQVASKSENVGDQEKQEKLNKSLEGLKEEIAAKPDNNNDPDW